MDTPDLDTMRGLCQLAGYEVRADVRISEGSKYLDVYCPAGNYLAWTRSENDAWELAYAHLMGETNG